MIEDSRDMVDEDLGSTLRLGTLLALLAVPGIASAEDLRNNLSKSDAVTTQSVVASMKAVDKSKKTYSGFTELQAANILARTLYMEARSEGEAGIDAVASVILNRAGPKSDILPAVCLRKGQFSCWTDISSKDPSTYKIVVPKKAAKEGKDRDAWLYCQKIAGKLLNSEFSSTIGTRNSYHTTSVSPKWDAKMTDKKTIGKHVFGYLPEYDGSKVKANKDNSYVVRRGDSLSNIASKHNTTVSKLLSLNPSLKKNPDMIKPGIRIKLPR